MHRDRLLLMGWLVSTQVRSPPARIRTRANACQKVDQEIIVGIDKETEWSDASPNRDHNVCRGVMPVRFARRVRD